MKDSTRLCHNGAVCFDSGVMRKVNPPIPHVVGHTRFAIQSIKFAMKPQTWNIHDHFSASIQEKNVTKNVFLQKPFKRKTDITQIAGYWSDLILLLHVWILLSNLRRQYHVTWKHCWQKRIGCSRLLSYMQPVCNTIVKLLLK